MDDTLQEILSLIPLLSLAGAIVLLLILSWIDLRTWLLPNKYVAAFALLAPVFHYFTSFIFTSPLEMAAGAVVGFGLLYGIRAVASRVYGQDALGLGDVKLMGAGGLWLGPEDILVALIAGAGAGLLHGLVYASWLTLRHKQPFRLKRLAIPAGPGFAIGLVVAGALRFS